MILSPTLEETKDLLSGKLNHRDFKLREKILKQDDQVKANLMNNEFFDSCSQKNRGFLLAQEKLIKNPDIRPCQMLLQ